MVTAVKPMTVAVKRLARRGCWRTGRISTAQRRARTQYVLLAQRAAASSQCHWSPASASRKARQWNPSRRAVLQSHQPAAPVTRRAAIHFHLCLAIFGLRKTEPIIISRRYLMLEEDVEPWQARRWRLLSVGLPAG